MPSLSRISSIFLCLFVCQYLLPNIVEAQPVRDFVHSVENFKKDYITDKPYRYSPDDPWERGNVFRMQTGHSGLFRNCDNEEQKRFSPYICWKVHNEPDFPGLRGARAFFSLDLCEVKQRIRDGAGCCAGNCGKPGCKRCSRKKASAQCTTCGIKGCTGCGANQVAVPADACDQCRDGTCPTGSCTTGLCTNGQASGTTRSRNPANFLAGRTGSRSHCSASQCENGCSSGDCAGGNCSLDRCKLCFGNQNRAPNYCGCVSTCFDENSPAGLLSYQSPMSVSALSSEPVEPASYYVEPSSNIVNPLSNTVQPWSIGTQPSSEAVQPWSVKTRSSSEAVQPSSIRTQSSSNEVQPLPPEPVFEEPCSCVECRLKRTREKLAKWNETRKAKDEQPTRSAKASGSFRLNRITADSLSR